MKKIYTTITVMAVLFCSCFQAQVSIATFSFINGPQSFTVPSCVSSITIHALGSQGGINAAQTTTGGPGGEAYGVLPVSAGDVLNVYVGGMNGYNGGGSPGNSSCAQAVAGYGGGASDVRLNGVALTDRVIVAGGGGGAGGDRISGCGRGTGGGGGGGYYGGGGGAGYPSSSNVVPTGGSQSAGGIGGTSAFSASQNGSPGALGLGGNGGTESSSNQAGTNTAMTGGSGGGLAGGNGQVQMPTVYTGHSGAGGSSYIALLSSASTSAGVRTGNGLVTFSYVVGGGLLQTSVSNPGGICPGGTMTLTASNVNSYTWSTGSNANSISVSPNVTTTYTVLGTNSLGCISTEVVTVQVNPPPVITTASSHTLLCVGDVITFTANGASTYTWQGTTTGNTFQASPAVSTTYSVSGTSTAGCVSTETVMANVNSNTLTLTSDTTICRGDHATLTAGGGTVYTWSTGSPFNQITVSPAAATMYTVSAYDVYGCAISGTAHVQVNARPQVNATTAHTVICKNEKVLLNATGATTYSWSSGGTGVTTTVMPTVNIPVTYTVVGTDGNGCRDTAYVKLTVNACNAVTELETDDLLIFPNPSTGIFLLKNLTPAITDIRITDATGRVVSVYNTHGDSQSVDLTSLPSGVYFAEMISAQKCVSRKKLIRE